MSWYKFDKKLTSEQQCYIESIRLIFKIKNAQGKVMDYKPESFQVESHIHTPMCLPKEQWHDVYIYKARGIGASFTRMMDMIMHAINYPGIIIPVVSHRFQQAKDLIRTGQWLVDNARVDLSTKVITPHIETEIRFTNGTIIRAYPSENLEALRGLRSMIILLDEMDFFRNIKRILEVAENVINQGGMILAQSTVYGRASEYWQMFEKYKQSSNKYVFAYHMFDPIKFDENRSILVQGLEPLGYWVDLGKLEESRQRDIAGFMQENMITPVSDLTSYLPFNLIKSCCDDSLKNSTLKSLYPTFIGIDFGRSHDFTVISAFEKTEFGYIMKYQEFLKNKSLPEQKMIIKDVVNSLHPVKVRCDMTGLGLGITEELKVMFGGVIEGINFGERFNKTPIKERMAMNMKTLMSDNKVRLFDDDLMIRHLSAVNYDFKSESNEEGHADAFWSIALALLPDEYKTIRGAFGSISSLVGNLLPHTMKTPLMEVKEIEEKKNKEIEQQEIKAKKKQEMLEELKGRVYCMKVGDRVENTECLKCLMVSCSEHKELNTKLMRKGLKIADF